MIKTRLLKLLKGSGKYIGANIFWQWIALLFQIAAAFAASPADPMFFQTAAGSYFLPQTLLRSETAVRSTARKY